MKITTIETSVSTFNCGEYLGTQFGELMVVGDFILDELVKGLFESMHVKEDQRKSVCGNEIKVTAPNGNVAYYIYNIAD